ncbi:hypothetical protein HMI55_004075, partial [Coelomomyces lativittatus]
NIKSTLSLATNQAELTNEDLFLLPLNLRPPSLRRDHWHPFLILDSFSNHQITKDLLDLLHKYDTPIPRHHRTQDPIMTKLCALTKALNALPSILKEKEINAHWEYMELKDQFNSQSLVMFPSNVFHHKLKLKRPAYYDRIKEYWESKSSVSTA